MRGGEIGIGESRHRDELGGFACRSAMFSAQERSLGRTSGSGERDAARCFWYGGTSADDGWRRRMRMDTEAGIRAGRHRRHWGGDVCETRKKRKGEGGGGSRKSMVVGRGGGRGRRAERREEEGGEEGGWDKGRRREDEGIGGERRGGRGSVGNGREKGGGKGEK